MPVVGALLPFLVLKMPGWTYSCDFFTGTFNLSLNLITSTPKINGLVNLIL